MMTGVGSASAPNEPGRTLFVRVHGREIALRHSDARVVARWESALSQRSSESTAHAHRRSDAERQRANSSSAWRRGAVRILCGDDAEAAGDFDERALSRLPLSQATLTAEGVLEITQADRPSPLASAHPHASGSHVVLRLPLASLVSVRLPPPYRPVLELVTDRPCGPVPRAAPSDGSDDRADGAQSVADGEVDGSTGDSCRWLMLVDGEEDLLGWMGMLLTLLPSCKPRVDLTSLNSKVARLPSRPTRLAPLKRASHAVGMSAAMRSAREHRMQARSLSVAGRPDGQPAGANGQWAGGVEELLVVGGVRVYTERLGMHRWVACHAHVAADGQLTVQSVERWPLRVNLVVRTATSIARLGPPSWPYLRLQTPQQALCLHIDGGDEPLANWIANLERASGLRLITAELAGWVELATRQAQLPSTANAQHADGDLATAWQPAFLALLTNRSLIWYSSAHSPKVLGAIDMQTCTGVAMAEDCEVRRDGGALEIETPRLCWRLRCDTLSAWQSQLTLSLEQCRRDAEAQRLISIHLHTPKNDGDDRASSRLSHRLSSAGGRISERLTTRLHSLRERMASRSAQRAKVDDYMRSTDEREAVGGVQLGERTSGVMATPPAPVDGRGVGLGTSRGEGGGGAIGGGQGTELAGGLAAAAADRGRAGGDSPRRLVVHPAAMIISGAPSFRDSRDSPTKVRGAVQCTCHLETRGAAGQGDGKGDGQSNGVAWLVGQLMGATAARGESGSVAAIELRCLLAVHRRFSKASSNGRAAEPTELRLLLPGMTLTLAVDRPYRGRADAPPLVRRPATAFEPASGQWLSGWYDALLPHVASANAVLETLPPAQAIVRHAGWLSRRNGAAPGSPTEVWLPVYCRLLAGGRLELSAPSAGAGTETLTFSTTASKPPIELDDVQEWSAPSTHRRRRLEICLACCAPRVDATWPTCFAIVGVDGCVEVFDANEEVNQQDWLAALTGEMGRGTSPGNEGAATRLIA